MQLRYYQMEAIERSIKYDNGYINLCTASGKSLIIAQTAIQINEPTLILQPNVEILHQNAAKIQNLSSKCDIGLYSASANSKDIAKYTLATIGSIMSQADKFTHFKNILIDECHLVNSKEGRYKTLIDILKAKKVIGFTGTPFRISQTLDFATQQYQSTTKFLHRTKGAIFKKMLYSYSAKQALADGFITPIRYITPKYSTRLLKMATADYNENSVFENNKANYIHEQILSTANMLTKESNFKGCLIFVAGIEEAIMLEALMKQNNFNVASVSGETAKKERQTIIEKFKNGEIHFVINVGVFTTGFDYPELDNLIIARPTFSLALYWQIVGRVLRLANNKPFAKVFDLCGNYARFGAMEDAEFVDIDKYDTGLICKDKILIEQAKNKKDNAEQVKITQTLDINKVAGIIEKLLKNNSVSEAEKQKIKQKRSSGKFDGKYLAELPDWHVKWLYENNVKTLANNIMDSKLLLQRLYNQHCNVIL